MITRILWKSGLWIRCYIIAIYFLMLAVTPAYAVDPIYEIKASYIYNFLQFVSFPEKMLQESQVNVCIVGENYFGNTLDQIDGAHTPQATIHIMYTGAFTGIESLLACNVLYLTQSEKNNTKAILHNLDTKKIFTIAEYSPFISLGGMVELYIRDDKVRFRINRALAKKSYFQISSQLLQLGIG